MRFCCLTVSIAALRVVLLGVSGVELLCSGPIGFGWNGGIFAPVSSWSIGKSVSSSPMAARYCSGLK